MEDESIVNWNDWIANNNSEIHAAVWQTAWRNILSWDPSLQIIHLQKISMEILDTSTGRDEAETARSKSHQAKRWVCDC